MGAKSSFVLYLQAVIGQVSHDVLWINVVLLAWGSEIPFIIEKQVKFVWVVFDMNEDPYTYVELPFLVKKRSFDVFLDDPDWIQGLFCQVGNYVPNFREEMNASALVQMCWF